MKSQAFAARCQRLRLVLSDVDGVLTDGALLLLPDGREIKPFHVRDGLAVVLAQRAGLRTGILSGRNSEVVEQRAAELGMPIVLQGVADKRAALLDLLKREQLDAAQAAYIGDDLNDLAVMAEVGLSAAPADAAREVRERALLVTDARGGAGCLREFIEAILRARGDWDRLVAQYDTPPQAGLAPPHD
jgi:3-deoxy-D-manno-octulosonate 8-phosphate phosphatase (KDO 8-P phosphatase)